MFENTQQIQHLKNQKVRFNMSAKCILHNNLNRKSESTNCEQEKTIKKQLSEETDSEVFKDIHTLLSLKDCVRKANRPFTLRDFKEEIEPQRSEKKIQSVVSLIKPQFLIKKVFQEHSHKLKINQIKYFPATKKGLRNFQTLENQDYIVTDRIASNFMYFCIFDGHGTYGKNIAQTSGLYFKNCVKSYEEQFKRQISGKQIVEIIKNCLKKTQSYLQNVKFNEIQYSGTTALIVLLTPKSIITFNIGNSRCVIGMKQENAEKIYDFQVTHEHDLNRLDERLRVNKKGAVISPLKNELGQNFGPDRLWNKNQKRPGTFITRALGLTCGSKAGIIADPQISILSYNNRMKFLVLASDGLWAVEENDQVIALLERYYRQEQLAAGTQSLIDEAVKRWKGKNELMDDISIIVVDFS